MPRLHDLALIRNILETDRPWAAYALADLEPAHAPFTTWIGADDLSAVALVYRAFAVPIVLASSTAVHIEPLLDEIDAELRDAAQFYGVVRPDVLGLLEQRYRILRSKHMFRMALDPAKWVPIGDAIRLGLGDLAAVQRLHADGDAANETPDFFLPSMLESGAFFGVFEGRDLVASAGTHAIAPSVSVAAIGNVYTRRDRRGQGLGVRVTSAVTNELVKRGMRTIVLNVAKSNRAAIRVYERLGFDVHCDYFEAVVVRC